MAYFDQLKSCSVCGREFKIHTTYDNKPTNASRKCCSRECKKIDYLKYMHKWARHHKEYYREKANSLHKIILNHYGKKCSCCGEKQIEFLTVDHINGKPKDYDNRKALSEYRRIIKEGFPNDIQVLCMNCNWSKRRFKGKVHCPVHHPEEYEEAKL